MLWDLYYDAIFFKLVELNELIQTMHILMYDFNLENDNVNLDEAPNSIFFRVLQKTKLAGE